MTASRALVLALALVCALVLAPVAGGALADVVQESDAGDDANGGESDAGDANRTMGAAVTGFMQSSTADADESVDTGMFVTAYETAEADERAALVDEREATLEAKLAALEDRREALEADRERTNPAYDARMAALAVRLSALESAIDDAEPRARAVGADVDSLAALRADARELAGPEVTAAASIVPGRSDGSVPGVGRGPPAGTPGEDRGSAAGNASDRSPPGQQNASASTPGAGAGAWPEIARGDDLGPGANGAPTDPGTNRGGPDRNGPPSGPQGTGSNGTGAAPV